MNMWIDGLLVNEGFASAKKVRVIVQDVNFVHCGLNTPMVR